MAKKAKVAVVTRTRDRGLLLRRALANLQRQTYQDFVHVVVNDGGRLDQLKEILEEYPVANRVVVQNEQPNMIRALNLGVRAIESEYVAIFDDDDTWAPERLEKTIPYLETTGAKAVVVKMDIVIEEVKDGEIHKISQKLHPQSGEGEISLFKQCYQNYLSNGVVTYRRDVFDELGGYDESLETAEDWDFGIRFMQRYDADFLRNEPPLFFYHQRPKQQGIEGNSVHAGVGRQEKTITMLRNRYLRADMVAGQLGVGYIMNRLAYDNELVIRLEGHVNYAGREVESKLLDAIKLEMIELNDQQPLKKAAKKARSLLGTKRRH